MLIAASVVRSRSVTGRRWRNGQTRGREVHLTHPWQTCEARAVRARQALPSQSHTHHLEGGVMEMSVAVGRDSVETMRVAGDREGASKGHTEGGDVVAGLAHEGQS